MVKQLVIFRSLYFCMKICAHNVVDNYVPMVMITEAWITSSLDKIRGILLGLFLS